MADLIATSGQVIDGPVNYDLVRIKTAGNCLIVRGNASGRIGRIELTNTSGSGDCLVSGNKTGTGRLDIGIGGNGKPGGGFFDQPTKSGTSHNDCYQARGGSHIHLYDIVFRGPAYDKSVNASQGVLLQNAQGFPLPTDIVCHRCVWCGRFSNPVNWGASSGCGIDHCYVIGSATKNYTVGATRNDGGGKSPIDVGNVINVPPSHPEIKYAYDNLQVSWLGAATTPPPPTDLPPGEPPPGPQQPSDINVAVARMWQEMLDHDWTP